MTRPVLVLLTGPVGGGKTTTSVSLAERLRASGHPSTTIDLDVLYCMRRQREGFDDKDAWSAAWRACAALADVFFSSGIDVVIIEGGFFTPEERAGVLDYLTTSACVATLTLNLSFDETSRRVGADLDPGRVASRDPAILEWHHDRFMEALPYLAANGLVVDTEDSAPAEVASRLALGVIEKLRASSA